LFTHFRQLNALELKGIHDPLTVNDHNLIMMRAYGLGVPKYQKKSVKHQEENEPTQFPNEITVTIVCVTRPNKILNELKEEVI